MEDLFRQRDALLHSSSKDILQLEEERQKERNIRWDKAVASVKKAQSSGSRKGGIAAPSTSTPPKQIKSTKEDTGEKEESEGHEERSKKQRTDDVDFQTSLATATMAKKPDTLSSTSPEKEVITSSAIGESSTVKENPTQNPDQPQSKSSQEAVLPPKGPESQIPESERTQQPQGGSETEKPVEQTREKSILITPLTDPPLTQPANSEREHSEMASMSKTDLLITSEVEEDNTIVSVGDYSFHTKSKVVMRRRTKRAESAIVWTP